VVTIDTVAPETTITAGPAPDTVDDSPTFRFESNDAQAGFRCSRDEAPASRCTAPWTYPSVEAGAHTFEVRAIDAAGNLDATPATSAFTLRAYPPPNILLIVTDDQPPDTMQVMPNASAYFGGGTTFTNGFDVQPLCCPSRASIFSGKYPHNHGIVINDGTSFDATETWQRYLHHLGYRTGIIGKYLNNVTTAQAPHFDYRNQMFPWDAEDEQAQLQASSRDFLTSAEDDDRVPWALVYATQSPHTPWSVQPANPTPIPPYTPPPSIDEADLTDKDPAIQAASTEFPLLPVDDFRNGIIRELEAVDEGLGPLFATLDALDESENLLSFYISDNGFLWGQHRLRAKQWPYRESVNVPFYIRWPGHVPAGATVDNLVANVDIAPTIFNATGTSPRYPVDGKPLVPTLPDRSWLLLESSPHDYGSIHIPAWRSYVTAARQYIEWADGFVEDYDLTADPHQMAARNQSDPTIAAPLDAAAACVGAACP
jgi:arylsulfatase A-like enzyme